MSVFVLDAIVAPGRWGIPGFVRERVLAYAARAAEAVPFRAFAVLGGPDDLRAVSGSGAVWRLLERAAPPELDNGNGYFAAVVGTALELLGCGSDSLALVVSPLREIVASGDLRAVFDAHVDVPDAVTLGVRPLNPNHHPSMLMSLHEADRVEGGFHLQGGRRKTPWRDCLERDMLPFFPPEREVKGSQFLPTIYRAVNHLLVFRAGLLDRLGSAPRRYVPLAPDIPEDYPLLARPFVGRP